VAETGTGTGTSSGAAPSAVGGGGGSVDGWSRSQALQSPSRLYFLRAQYFRRELFKSTADCLTAAYTQRLPLEVCQ
jgi:hypothetical protein